MSFDPITRRHMLTAAAALLGASPLARAIDPIRRAGRRRMSLSLAAYSMRRFFTAKSEDRLDMPGFVDFAAGLDLDAVELTSYWFPDPVTPEFLAGLKRRCHINGLDISGGAIRNNFTLPPGDKLDHWFDHVETWINHYADLGAPVIRIFAGNPPKGTTDEQGIARAIPNIERACEMAGRRGVMLALENHDYLTKIDRMMPIVQAVQSPWFGVNLDTGNFHSDDPYDDIARAAPYAVNVQVKVKVKTRPTGRGHEPTDFARLFKILKEADYSGPVVLEYEASEDPHQAIPRYLDTMRQLM